MVEIKTFTPQKDINSITFLRMMMGLPVSSDWDLESRLKYQGDHQPPGFETMLETYDGKPVELINLKKERWLLPDETNNVFELVSHIMSGKDILYTEQDARTLSSDIGSLMQDQSERIHRFLSKIMSQNKGFDKKFYKEMYQENEFVQYIFLDHIARKSGKVDNSLLDAMYELIGINRDELESTPLNGVAVMANPAHLSTDKVPAILVRYKGVESTAEKIIEKCKGIQKLAKMNQKQYSRQVLRKTWKFRMDDERKTWSKNPQATGKKVLSLEDFLITDVSAGTVIGSVQEYKSDGKWEPYIIVNTLNRVFNNFRGFLNKKVELIEHCIHSNMASSLPCIGPIGSEKKKMSRVKDIDWEHFKFLLYGSIVEWVMTSVSGVIGYKANADNHLAFKRKRKKKMTSRDLAIKKSLVDILGKTEWPTLGKTFLEEFKMRTNVTEQSHYFKQHLTFFYKVAEVTPAELKGLPAIGEPSKSDYKMLQKKQTLFTQYLMKENLHMIGWYLDILLDTHVDATFKTTHQPGKKMLKYQWDGVSSLLKQGEELLRLSEAVFRKTKHPKQKYVKVHEEVLGKYVKWRHIEELGVKSGQIYYRLRDKLGSTSKTVKLNLDDFVKATEELNQLGNEKFRKNLKSDKNFYARIRELRYINVRYALSLMYHGMKLMNISEFGAAGNTTHAQFLVKAEETLRAYRSIFKNTTTVLSENHINGYSVLLENFAEQKMIFSKQFLKK